jgi:hypothetical protein
MSAVVIMRWHEIVATRNLHALTDLLADQVVFESPVVHSPQVGKALTLKYLASALEVLNNDSFIYLNEWHAENSAVLEFQSTCEGITINGVDIISWDEHQQITAFKVMVRPLKAVNKLHELMGRQLSRIE